MLVSSYTSNGLAITLLRIKPALHFETKGDSEAGEGFELDMVQQLCLYDGRGGSYRSFCPLPTIDVMPLPLKEEK